MNTESIDLFLDFACPWSYIGLQKVANAQTESTQNNNATVPVNYRAFQLNPTFPAEGIARETYRINKFGSLAESQRRDAAVTQAAAAAGIPIDFAGIPRAPNTRLAHRALKVALDQNKGAEMALRIYRTYFTEQLDIGDPDVLLDIAESLDVPLTIDQLKDGASPQDKSIDADAEAARKARLTGVPFFVANTAEGAHTINLSDAIESIKHEL